MTTDSVNYPVSFDVRRDAQQSRLTNFPLGVGITIRSILLIPHLIILYFMGIIAMILYLVASFAILFSGVYPAGMYNFIAAYVRWNARTNAYMLSMFDKYPPFNGEESADSALSLLVDYPPSSSKLLNFPIIGIGIKGILLIPHLIILSFLGIAVAVVVFIAQFAILFSGSFPEGMHNFCVGVSRWSIRLNAYILGLTDQYPPFGTR